MMDRNLFTTGDVGTISGEELAQIKKALALIWDIEPEHCQL